MDRSPLTRSTYSCSLVLSLKILPWSQVGRKPNLLGIALQIR